MAEHIPNNAQQSAAESSARRARVITGFTIHDRLRRTIWRFVWVVLFRPSPRPLHAWRALLLRAFGAKMGRECHFYPSSRIWAPWNLVCSDQVTAGDGAEIYNPEPLYFGSHAILSQGALICGGTHDMNDPAYPLLAYSASFGSYSWVCARAVVSPGVNVGNGAVLGLGSVATRDLEPWSVYGGVPAQKIKDRQSHEYS